MDQIDVKSCGASLWETMWFSVILKNVGIKKQFTLYVELSSSLREELATGKLKL
jgi:hypothetical protein